MRLSALPDDPGYSLSIHRAHILIDGEVFEGVVLADDETGEFAAQAFDDNGEPILQDGQPVYFRGEAHVQITFPTLQ